jgi:hypothetical protein
MSAGIGSEAAIRGVGWFLLWWQVPLFIARSSHRHHASFIKRHHPHPAMVIARLGRNFKMLMVL